MSGSVILSQPGALWTPKACFATKGHNYGQSLGFHLWSCRCPRVTAGAMLIWVACAATKGHGVARAKLGLGVLSRCSWGLWPMLPHGAIGTMCDEIREPC